MATLRKECANSLDVFAKSALKAAAIEWRGKSSDRKKEIQQRTVSQELFVQGSEARNTNYKLAAHIIAIFSRVLADAKGRHIAVATLMW